MPLKKLLFKSGVNRENTRYTNEGGWFECNNCLLYTSDAADE